MGDNTSQQPSEDDAALEREIRQERTFSLEEAIGRMAGPGAMKGASPLTLLEQADLQIAACLEHHLTDTGGGELTLILRREVQESEALLQQMDRPLAALATYCRETLASEYRLKELVRNADVEWGRTMGERPYFEREGAAAHPEDPYTIASVRQALSQLLERLAANQ